MAERIYYADCYGTEFDAKVLHVQPSGGRQIVRLDRTAFYPTSGGQPHDVGTLGAARVVDVIDDEDGDVLHVVEGALQPGEWVKGRIDWTRRFDHMQQHTGQHVLSAAFDSLFGARTESFHLGADASSIDLGQELSPDQIERAEEDANRIVWADHPVTIAFVDAADAAAMPLRKEPARSGTLRLVDIDGYDLSACGGTHVARTGAIGIIAITGWERFRGGLRIGFVCGGRALRAHRRLRDITAASIRLLSVLPEELPAAIERQQGEAKESKRVIRTLQTRLAGHEAQALAAASSDGRVVTALGGWDQQGLKSIASAIAEREGHVAALLSAEGPAAIVIARHPSTSINCAEVLKQVVARFGGKGGGRPELAQGGGLQGESAVIVDYLRELL
jgi:alanyl-tRNA synthetase